MNKSQLAILSEETINELRELPYKTRTTSAKVLESLGYELEKFDENDLREYHESLLLAAKTHNITIEMTEPEEETPVWDTEFIVRNRMAQIKCPYCGSRRTARIIHGMPAFSAIKDKLDAERLYIGGCIIYDLVDDYGNRIISNPEYHCNACKKEFGTKPYYDYKGEFLSYPEVIESIEFTTGGYFGGTKELIITAGDDGALVHVNEYPIQKETPIQDKTIPYLKWLRIINRLYNDFYLHEWTKKYEDPDVYDGEQWSLVIKIKDGNEIVYSGSNAYPPYWKELNSIFKPYLKH